MECQVLPCRRDNYAYLLTLPGAKSAVVVDPSEPEPVLRALSERGLGLAAIWNTHHHYDHVGGNEALKSAFPQARVLGHVSDAQRIPSFSQGVEEGDEIEDAGVRAKVLHGPGHTTGAVSYLVDGAIFTGDTLFAAGCGRLFEGTPAQMYSSIARILSLPKHTKIYCGHEYTQSNLRFAQSVEPGNVDISERLERVSELRAQGEHTMGFQIDEERRTNVFYRTQEAEVVASARAHAGKDLDTEEDVFAEIRLMKDSF